MGIVAGRLWCTVFTHTYQSIISIENFLVTWERFLRGKKHKKDVIKFQAELATNIVSLYNDLKNKTYIHGPYSAFNISDPKPRNIHKASVRDRIVHHLLHKELYPYFHNRLIYDSYSCREGKGTHRALDRFRDFARKVSKNHTRTCFVLKCDIKKFFASIDHQISENLLAKSIPDQDVCQLLCKVIGSFHSKGMGNVGLPLGNLTSQLLVNIYMNEFDQFVKRKLNAPYYIRYADDFVIFSEDKKWLENILSDVADFLRMQLHLELHPKKVSIATVASWIDFLGWVHFPDHRVLRTATKRRMLSRLANDRKEKSVDSYLGLLSHGNTHGLSGKVRTEYSDYACG